MRKVRHNLRWLSVLLSMAMAMVATISNAEWRCQDGTLCSMLHPSVSPVSIIQDSQHPAASEIRSCCAQRAHSNSEQISGRHCLLSETVPPVAAVQHHHVVAEPTVGQPVPQFAITASAIVKVSVPQYRCSAYFPPLLRIHSGRAPPRLF